MSEPEIVVPEAAKDPEASPPPAEEAKENKPAQAPMLVPISQETGELAPTNHRQLMAFIDQMIQAKALPKNLETREKVLVAWNYAAQLGLPPQPSLRNIAVIHGTPSLFGDLPLALAQKHADYVWHEEFCIDVDYKKICFENKNLEAGVFAAVCIVMRKGMKAPESFHFTWDEATRAGINDAKTSSGKATVWANYPQVMLTRKARAIMLRAKFADALCGANIAEHDLNEAPDLVDVTHSEDKAANLNKRFTEAKDVNATA